MPAEFGQKYVTDQVRTGQAPLAFPRGSVEITYADLPHQQEINAVDRNIVIPASGVIDWQGDRPDEHDLQTGDRLEFLHPTSGAAVSTLITRAGTGTPPNVTIAAGQRPTNADFYPYYTSEDRPIIAVGTGASAITWGDAGRPPMASRTTGARLYDSDGVAIGTVTWADAGDMVNPGAAAGSLYLWHTGSTRLHRDHLTDLITFDGGYPTGVAVGDVIVIDDGGPFERRYTVTMVDDDAEALETSNDSGGTGSESVRGWVIYKPGRRLEGYSLRLVGFLISTWQLYSDGSYYGEDGLPDHPTPFLLEITDVSTNGAVQLVDLYGNEHAWTGGADGDYWPNKTTPNLVREVRHGTTIAKFRAHYL